MNINLKETEHPMHVFSNDVKWSNSSDINSPRNFPTGIQSTFPYLFSFSVVLVYWFAVKKCVSVSVTSLCKYLNPFKHLNAFTFSSLNTLYSHRRLILFHILNQYCFSKLEPLWNTITQCVLMSFHLSLIQNFSIVCNYDKICTILIHQ